MLHELQSCFLKGIYDVDSEPNAYPFIQETNEKTAKQQLSVYRSSIFGGLKKALAETYPVTKSLVGDDFFNMMLGQYIKKHPCKVQDLNDYGQELPIFIENLKQAKAVPYLADMARLEWFYNIAFNAKVQENNLSDLSLLTIEQQLHMKLGLANGGALIHSQYPIDEIWNKHQINNEEIKINDECVNLIIWKEQSEIRIERMSEEQFYFLGIINRTITFEHACEDVINIYPEADINSLFAAVLQNNWLRSFAL